MKTTFILKLTLFLALMSSTVSFANSGTITGMVVDDLGPLPGASIRLFRCDSDKEIRGVITDLDGRFVISGTINEEVYLEIRYLGYETLLTDPFTLKEGQSELDLDVLLLIPITNALETVSIQGKKRTVSFTDGKTRVQIAENPMTQGESAYSLLNKLPGVSVGQQGEILLNGKPGVKVMVNGHLIYMEGDDLKTYLESLPSDAIVSIDLDTKPSAALDAAGGAGVLNINLKKSESKSLAGTVSSGYTYQDRHLWNGNIFLNKQYEHWDWSLIADASEQSNKRRRFFYTDYNEESTLDRLEQDGREVRKRRPLFLQIDANAALTEKQKVGINVQGGHKNSLRKWNSITEVKAKEPGNIEHIKAFNNGEEVFNYGLMSAYYRLKTDTLGSNFRFTTDASIVKREITTEFRNEFNTGMPDERLSIFKTPSDNEYQIIALRGDYQNYFRNGGVLKLGGKYSFIDFNSAVNYFAIIDGVEHYIEDQSNAFNYSENILAVYAEYEGKLDEKWKLDAGLRMEQTWGEGVERIMENRHKKNYLEFFPSVSLQQEISKDYQLVYSYFKRITRPQYEFLNPQIFHIDPYNYIKGNPSLKPQLSHSVEVKNIIKRKYQMALTFDYYKNLMGEVPILNTETHKNEYSMRNMDRAIDVGMNAYIPTELTKFWNMNNSIVTNYQWYSLDLEETKRSNGHWFLQLQHQQQLKLPKEFLFGINLLARGRSIMGYYTFEPQWGADMFLNKSVGDRWNFNLKVADVFRSMKMKAQYQFNGNQSGSSQYAGNQFVSFQAKYRFGTNNKKSGIDKKSDFEEFNRINK